MILPSDLTKLAARLPTDEAKILHRAANIIARYPQGRAGSTVERGLPPAVEDIQSLKDRVWRLEAEVFKPLIRHRGERYRFPNGVSSCTHCGQNWTDGPFCAR